jgi:hypothetical protein
VLLLLPILIMGRRWRLPYGVPTVLVAVPAILMHLMFSSDDGWWPALTVAAAAAGAELVLRAAKLAVRWSSDVRWFAAGLTAPLLVWGALLIVADRTVGVGWNVHMVTGLLTLVAITGALTALVVRNVRPLPAAPGHATTTATDIDNPTAAGDDSALTGATPTATGDGPALTGATPAATGDGPALTGATPAAAGDDSRAGVPAP